MQPKPITKYSICKRTGMTKEHIDILKLMRQKNVAIEWRKYISPHTVQMLLRRRYVFYTDISHNFIFLQKRGHEFLERYEKAK